jgi:hypothetical protein
MKPKHDRQARVRFANGATGVAWQYLRMTT